MPFDLNLQNVLGAIFHIFMFFVVVYSALNIFALIRFGQSRLVGFAVFIIYGLVLFVLYLQAGSIIAGF